ncbi:MAG: pyridoxal phosphate-dependent aminotransferase [Thermoanaerobaculia bacterium]
MGAPIDPRREGRLSPPVSHRGRAMPASPIRRLMPLAEAAKKRGVRVYHLNIGQPDLETPRPMRERLVELPDPVIAYSPSPGTPEFLRVLREYYERAGISLSIDQLIATTGGSEALQFAFFSCADVGDEALLVEPFYTNYQAFATLAGVRLVALRTRVEDGFHLPPRAEWDRAVTPRTRFVLLCNPNNPTGTVYRQEELETVAAFCREHGLFLVSDEVYREFVYDGRQSISALTLEGFEEQVVVVDSLSKRFSACGLRLGNIATRNKELYQACLRMAQGRLSPPGLAQLAALGIHDLPPSYTEEVVSEYRRRRDLLYEGLRGIPGVFLRQPEGAFYFIARLPIRDCDRFASWLLTDFQHDGATVMVAPARGFYATPGLGADEVRIAYVLRREDLAVAVEIFGIALAEYARVEAREDRAPVTAGVAAEGPDFTIPVGS